MTLFTCVMLIASFIWQLLNNASAMGDRVTLTVLVTFLYTMGVFAAPKCECNAEFDTSGKCDLGAKSIERCM